MICKTDRFSFECLSETVINANNTSLKFSFPAFKRFIIDTIDFIVVGIIRGHPMLYFNY
jgi:hypothetical protein